jgi:hypothetical protein
MSYELKMQGVGNGKRSGLYKKTKRASMNKIDATHLPMRVQSDKGGYWGQTSRGLVHIPYSKIVYLVSSVRWESLQDPNDKAIGIYGKKAVEQLKEFVIAKVVGYGSQYAVTVWKSSTYKNWSINDYYYYVVKISDIEAYKKEKYKL